MSNFFPNPLQNQLAIVHRQGSDNALYFLGFLFIFELGLMVRFAREIDVLGFFLFFGLVIVGFIVYVILTIGIRKLFYFSISHGQGLSHPKFILSILMLVFLGTPVIDIRIKMILTVVAAISTIDVLLQNQMHDIISRIGPNSWDLNLSIPVFQIPFERDIKIEVNQYNEFLVILKTKEKTKILKPHRWVKINPNDLQDDNSLLSSFNEYSLSVVISHDESSVLKASNVQEIYRSDNLDELRELVYEMNNLVKIKYL